MKKLFNLGVICLLVINFISCSTDKRFDVDLIPYQKKSGGEWGYIDVRGREVIKPDFDIKPSLFSEGRAFVLRKENYQFIDKKGDYVGDKYVDVTMFSEGMACVVKKDERPTYVNKNMKTVLEVPYQKAGIFRGGLAKVCNKEGKWGFINKKGKLVIDTKYSDVWSFSEGLAVVYDEEGQCGIIDKKGNVVKEFSEDIEYSPFSDGLALFWDESEEAQGYINKKGKVVIEGDEDYEYYPFVNGYATFEDDDGEFGLIDKKGKVKIKPKYDIPLVFFNGLAVYNDDDEYGFINMKGKKVIKADYDDIGLPFIKGNAIVKDGRKYKIINKSGDKLDSDKIYGIDRYMINNLYDDEYPSIYYYEDVVVSDYFDMGLLLDDVCVNDPSDIKGITTSTGLNKTAEVFGISEDQLSNSSGKTITKYNALSSGTNYDITVGLVFNKSVKQPKTEYKLTSYYDYETSKDAHYYSVENTEYEVNDNNVLESVTYTVVLKKDKLDLVIDSLAKRMAAAGYDDSAIKKLKPEKKKEKKADVDEFMDDPYQTEYMEAVEEVQVDNSGEKIVLTKNEKEVGTLNLNEDVKTIEITYYLMDKDSEVLLSEDFEDNKLDAGIKNYYTSKYTVSPSIVESEALEGKANYSFGKSACSYNCNSVYSDLVIQFEKPVYVSVLEFKELNNSSSYYSYNSMNIDLYVDGEKSDVKLAESSGGYSYSSSKSNTKRIGVHKVVSEIVFAGNNLSDDDHYQIDELNILGKKSAEGTKPKTDSIFFNLDKLTTFTGTVGSQKIEGRIVRSGKSLSGYYMYENGTHKIALKGNVDDGSKSFHLNGTNEKGRKVEELKGSYKNGITAECTLKNISTRRTSSLTLKAN